MAVNGFEAVVFDLDGTLIDSAPDVGAAVNRLLESRGRRGLDGDELRTMIGFGANTMLERAFAATGESLAADRVEEAVAGYRDFYMGHLTDLTTVYPGVRETLHALAGDGVVMGICSNKPHGLVRRVLEALAMDRFFKALTGGDNVPHCKPDGRHVHLTLEMMGAGGKPAAMVGDSETDMAAGRNAGVAVIAVDYGYSHGPPQDLDADALIGHFGDLPATLERLAARLP